MTAEPKTRTGASELRRCWIPILGLTLLPLLLSTEARTQLVTELTVEVKTKDKRFAGTDDDIHLQIGGHDFLLDNPDKDDFERGNTDVFRLAVPGRGLDLEWLRQLGSLCVTKTEDSFWGGGWSFEGIKILGHGPTPLYENPDVDVSLDGDDNQWCVTTDDPGWNLPEPPPPWPPCLTIDVEPGGGTIVDSDCDGIPDESDLTFDEPVDSDGDGLPDLFEQQNGSDPLSSDSDGDGWSDGRNFRSVLVLTRIECLDENEDIGRDEIYVVSEDVRFPVAVHLRASWPMNDNTEVVVNTIIDSRVAAGGNASPADGLYRTRLRLRESDFEFFESPTDDTYAIFKIRWPFDGTLTVEHKGDDFHYRLSFRTLKATFRDPTPTDPLSDRDDDGLAERLEFLVSSQGASVQPTAIDGYDGLADPEGRDLFVEVDASGADHAMSFNAKQMVVSQLYYHGVTTRMDDGYLGGGQILPHEQTFTLNLLESATYKGNPSRFSPERASHYRYGIFVDEIEGGFNGRANRPGQNFLVSRTTMVGHFSAIVLLHELGHTMSLCHPEGGEEKPFPSGSCPTPPDWDGGLGMPCIVATACCAHYCGVRDDDPTAMGDDVDWSIRGTINGAAIGVGTGVVVGGLIGGPVGAIVGGVVGGLIGGVLGGFLDSGAYERVVDFHPEEWAHLQMFQNVVVGP